MEASPSPKVARIARIVESELELQTALSREGRCTFLEYTPGIRVDMKAALQMKNQKNT